MRICEGYTIAEEARGSSDSLRIPDKILTEHALAAEYAEICRFPVEGVYITPCTRLKNTLCGAIFVRKGYFGGGIFRFNIYIPEDFPKTVQLPKVIFEREIFHPSIDLKTRQLDLSRCFPEGWKRDRHTIRRVIVVLQRSFYSFEINSEKCVNPEAAMLFKEDRSKFKEISTENVEASRALVYDDVQQKDDPNAIKFLPWDHITHKQVREKMTQIGTGKHFSGTAADFRRSQICSSRSLQLAEVVGKSYPASYSWFDPTEMTVVTAYKPSQEVVTKSSARLNREKHGIEPLDLSDISNGE